MGIYFSLISRLSIEEKFAHVKVLVASTDVTDKRKVNTAFAEFSSGGKVDVLVGGAAMIGLQDPVRDVDNEKFLDAIQQNLRGSLHVAQAFLRHASPHVVVIDINSSAAHVNFGAGFSAYNVAKLAIFRLWDSLAAGNPGFSTFHIQPGIVDTDMNKEAGVVQATGIKDHVSLPANFHIWLASREAQFLKGEFLWTNRDVDELKANAEEIETSGLLSIWLGG